MQWGHMARSSGSGHVFTPVTFPHSFNSRCGAITGQWLSTNIQDGNMQGVVQTGSVSNTGCSIAFWWDGSKTSYFWMAIGK